MPILTEIFKSQSITDRFQYLSHTFADKNSFLPLASADLLAWQWYTQKKRDKTLPPRKDLMALIRPNDMHMDLNEERLNELFDHLSYWRKRFS